MEPVAIVGVVRPGLLPHTWEVCWYENRGDEVNQLFEEFGEAREFAMSNFRKVLFVNCGDEPQATKVI